MKLYSISQRIKKWLVSLGPNNPFVRLALSLHGRLNGFRVTFLPDSIKVSKGRRAALVGYDHYFFAPAVVRQFDLYFNTIAARPVGDESILDFSKPGPHRYLSSDLELICPNIPEDESMDAYLDRFKISEGMVVYDVGANAGLTTCLFSRAVGTTGKVYAFEPDDNNRQYLLENVKRLGLSNVTVLDWAIGDKNGEAAFHMDGTMGARLTELALYPGTATTKAVKVVTLENSCEQLGCAPQFIKMDIEGAEIGVIQAALNYLQKVPIHFSIESNHPMKDGTLTYYELDRLFQSIGYEVVSSDKYGQMFTWAAPVLKK